MVRTYLLLGSNEGDRANFLENARHRIAILAGKPAGASSIYETAAWGKTDQKAFLNQVLAVDTNLGASLLMDTLLAIENSLGRKRPSEKWTSRTIDIDLLFYGDSVIKQPDLTVPHPAIAERRFTLVPLAEVANSLVHPVSNKTVEEMLKECTDALEVKKI
jgi:2-amino-4-hydroxy-6-hydroxymethyldihydropteridine diphosphokinase